MRLILICLCCSSFLVQINTAVCGYRNALSSINELNQHEASCRYLKVRLPEHSNYKLTNCAIVNSHLQKRFIKFLQQVRKLDYPDKKRLVEQGLGTALSICHSFQKNEGNVQERWEANLLQPLFTKRRFLRCILRKTDLIACLERYTKEDGKGDVEVEMTITAIHFVKLAMKEVTGCWFFLDEAELNRLRLDESAIQSVREWDRLSTIPKVLYLTFILHARRLISVITRNNVEPLAVSNLQSRLAQTLNLEFPNNMLIQVRRENVPCRVIFNLDDLPRNQVHVEEVILVMVQQRLNIENTPRIYINGTLLYISVPQYYGEEDPQELERLFVRVVDKLRRNNYMLNINPTAFLI